jgi:excisionase family DNA binding protein
MSENLLTSNEVMAQLRISRSTLHRLRRTGELPSVELGPRAVRFRQEDVDHLIEAHLTQDAQVDCK